jgi:hypothetical protein
LDAFGGRCAVIRLLFALVVSFVALGRATSVHAYSDPALFSEPATQGGGEGRFFTGSPVDGYTCAVCHRGAATPSLSLYGLPEVLDPGTTYQVTLRWTQPEISHALQLELLTERGQTPVVSLTPEPMLTRLSRCESAPDGEVAAYAFDLPGRRVLGVRDCGAGELSFSFVAPDSARVYLTASLVRSDSMGTAEGDGVLDLKRTLHRRGAQPDAGGGCALAGPSSASSGGGLAALLLVLLLRACARHGRSALRLGALLLAGGCYQAEQSADYEPVDGGFSIALDAALGAGLDAGPPPGVADASTGSTLLFRVRTMAYGGRYAPLNVGAIWVERAEGGYVKTLERWAGVRAMYLRNWQRIARGDVTDAITGATLAAHRVHEVRWDFTDVTGATVPDGNYKIGLETTDRDAVGALHYVPFVKGPAAMQPIPMPSPQFVDMALTITP